MRTGSRRKACTSASTPGSSSPPRRRTSSARMMARNRRTRSRCGREALAGGESGRFELPFPTTRHLIKLGEQPSVSEALAESRGKNIVTVLPVMTRLNGGRQLLIPKEAGYDGDLFEVGAQG